MSRSMFTVLAVGVVLLVEFTAAQRRLALPDPRSCANRVRHATYRDARGVAHSYFFSWEHQPTKSLEVDWLDARNICRRHCMDAVSLETPQENEFIKQRISRGNIRYIWTSGRKCNFAGCDRPGETLWLWVRNSLKLNRKLFSTDLQPPNENGWFWSGSGVKIGPTTQRNTGDWSYTGGYNQAQPDNREAAQGNDESCLSILNNFYNDGLKWVSFDETLKFISIEFSCDFVIFLHSTMSLAITWSLSSVRIPMNFWTLSVREIPPSGSKRDEKQWWHGNLIVFQVHQ